MSFLDNLESTLKTLEGRSERDVTHDRRKWDDDRARSRAAAPHAEALKKGPFVNEFLTHAVRIGHSSRTRIHMNWVGNTLRVEAREKRLELTPTAEGVRGIFYENGEETRSEIVDLQNTRPEDLAQRWLA